MWHRLLAIILLTQATLHSVMCETPHKNGQYNVHMEVTSTFESASLVTFLKHKSINDAPHNDSNENYRKIPHSTGKQ